jgi:uncharacterized protein (TIGR02594 family)
MTLPSEYRWLETIGPLPRMVEEALKLLGTVETAGPANNPTILSWAKEVGVPAVYTADSIPWCGLFMAVVATRAGKPLVSSPLWALSWSKFGVAGGQPRLGDVLTFVRNGGGHVALYIGEDDVSYHVLGGNQHDCVCFTSVAKARLYACRRPAYNQMPETARPFTLARSGSLSSNEA